MFDTSKMTAYTVVTHDDMDALIRELVEALEKELRFWKYKLKEGDTRYQSCAAHIEYISKALESAKKRGYL